MPFWRFLNFDAQSGEKKNFLRFSPFFCLIFLRTGLKYGLRTDDVLNICA